MQATMYNLVGPFIAGRCGHQGSRGRISELADDPHEVLQTEYCAHVEMRSHPCVAPLLG